MKRVAIISFRTLVAILLPVIVVMWIFSYHRSDIWSWLGTAGPHVSGTGIETSRGLIEIRRERGDTPLAGEIHAEWSHHSIPHGVLMFEGAGRTILERAGFRWTSEPNGFVAGCPVTSGRWTVINFPFWCVAALAAVPLAAWILPPIIFARRKVSGFPVQPSPMP